MSATADFARQFGGTVEPASPAEGGAPAQAPSSADTPVSDTEAFAQRFGGALDLTTGEKVVGGAEALASGATFGLAGRASDAIQGVMREGPYADARDQARTERERRAAGMGGVGTALEVAGGAAPALLSGGTSLAGTAARALPAGMAAQAAEAVSAQVLKRFGPGIMSGIAQTALGTAVGGAIASGVQELADRLPLFGDDPLEAAQQILWEAGKGALTGLGLGAALGVTAGGARKTLELGARAADAAARAAERIAPKAAARRAWAATARGARVGPELQAAGGAEAVGRVLLQEGVPLAGGRDAVRQSLEGKLAAASKTVIEVQEEVAAGTASAGALRAASLREQALMVARDAAADALERAPQGAAGGMEAAIGAGIGLATGGTPGAVLGAAAGRLGRSALAGERAGIEALALDQLAHLAGQRAGLVSAADRVGQSVESIARVAGRTGAALAPLRDKDVGAELDAQIGQAMELVQPDSPARALLQAQAEQLDMVHPGLGQGYAQAALRRAEIMSENVSPSMDTLHGGVGGEVDVLTRMKLARRSIALQNPEAALARVAKGVESSEDAYAIQFVYPRVWERFTRTLSERLQKREVGWSEAIELGVRTGIPTTPSLSPDSILSAQMSAQASAQAQAAEQESALAGRPDFGTKGWRTLERYGDKADRLESRGSR